MKNKIETVEIDLSEYPKDLLIRFIIFAHENNLTCNEAIVKLFTDYLPKLDTEDQNQLQLPLK
jgi:hypothetical protein